MIAFTQLLDRGLSAEGGGTLAAWNPAMDLLALALEGQLAVHRLNWQRLWWTSPDAPVTGAAGHGGRASEQALGVSCQAAGPCTPAKHSAARGR